MKTLIILMVMSLIFGCTLPASKTALTPQEWKLAAFQGACGYESVSGPEYAFYEFNLKHDGGPNPTFNWRLEPGQLPGVVTPSLVSDIRLKQIGEAERIDFRTYIAFVTEECQKLFLPTGLYLKTADDEKSIYRVSDLHEAHAMKGQIIHVISAGTLHSRAPIGVPLVVVDIVKVVNTRIESDQTLKFSVEDEDGTAYVIPAKRAYYTLTGNSDPETLKYYAEQYGSTWRSSSFADEISGKTSNTAISPSKNYDNYRSMNIGLKCFNGTLQFFVNTETFLQRKGSKFNLYLKIDSAQPFALSMNTFSNFDRGGYATASQQLIKQLTNGHRAYVRVITWDNDHLDAHIPLLGAQSSIAKIIDKCQS